MKLRNKNTGLIGEMVIMCNGEIGVSCPEATYGYDSLSEFLSEGWEDYIPPEPLIKDEKIRKAVRAWAYLASVGKDKVLYHIVGTKKEFEYYGNCLRFGSFDVYIGNLEDKTYYTIAELCGGKNEN